MAEQAVDPKAIAATTDARLAGNGGARSLSVGLVAVAALAVGVGVGVGIGAGVWTPQLTPPAFKPLAWFTAVSVGQRTGVPLTMTAHSVAGGFLYVNLTLPRDSLADLMMVRWDAVEGGSLYSTAATAALFDAYARGHEDFGEDFNIDSVVNPDASPVYEPRGMMLAAATVMIRTVCGTDDSYAWHVT